MTDSGTFLLLVDVDGACCSCDCKGIGTEGTAEGIGKRKSLFACVTERRSVVIDVVRDVRENG